MRKEKDSKETLKVFQDDWLENRQCKPLLCRVKTDEHKFVCFVCQKVLELSTAGQSALTDHAKGKKHMDSLGKRNSFFKHVKVKQVEADVNGSRSETKAGSPEQQTLERCLSGPEATKSEIL